MKQWMILLVLATASVAFAQNEGDRKDVDGQVFEFQKEIWVHKALGTNFDPKEEYTAVHRDDKWRKWYAEGSPTLKKILDLGPNVVFTFQDRSGQANVYWVLESQDRVEKLLAGGAAVLLPGIAVAGGAGGGAAAGGAAGAAGASGSTIFGASALTVIGVGGAVVAAAVIVENNEDDDDDGTQ